MDAFRPFFNPSTWNTTFQPAGKLSARTVEVLGGGTDHFPSMWSGGFMLALTATMVIILIPNSTNFTCRQSLLRKATCGQH